MSEEREPRQGDRVHHISKSYCTLLLRVRDHWIAHQERSGYFRGGMVYLDDRFHNCTATGIH